MNKEERDNPLFISIIERVSKLEVRVEGLEKSLSELSDRMKNVEDKIEKIDSRVWYVLAGIAISIIVQVLMRLIP